MHQACGSPRCMVSRLDTTRRLLRRFSLLSDINETRTSEDEQLMSGPRSLPFGKSSCARPGPVKHLVTR